MNEVWRLSALKDRLRGLFSKQKSHMWLVILGLCGILLIGVSAIVGDDSTSDEEVDVSRWDPTAYASMLEERLEKMVTSIDGVGNASVTVMLENGIEYVYADEETSNSDRSERHDGVDTSDDNRRTVVTVDAESGKEGLLITEIQPTVRGVVVVCDGASDDTVASMVTNAVKTALDIPDKRVCVIPYSDERVE